MYVEREQMTSLNILVLKVITDQQELLFPLNVQQGLITQLN